MDFLLLTKSNTFIIGPISSILGYIMDGIFRFCSMFGVENIGLCIILFTIIVNVLMLPATIKQQKFSKMNSVMTPEIQAIQKKYGNTKDQAQMQKQQAELSAVYEKYGTSPTSGCLPMLIQLPIMFALYRVIYNIPAYVPAIKGIFLQTASPLWNNQQYITKITEMASAKNITLTSENKVVDFLYTLTADGWEELAKLIPDLSDIITKTADSVSHLNAFFGISLMEAPGFKLSWALLIPILAGVTQFISARLMTIDQPQMEEGGAASTMKTMNTVMPIMSVVFCINLPAAVGIYWVASSVVRTIMQLGINSYMKKMDVQDMIKANIEKKNKKRARQGLPPINENATLKSANKSIEIAARKKAAEEERQAKLRQEGKSSSVKTGGTSSKSIAARAGMVKDYNDKNKR